MTMPGQPSLCTRSAAGDARAVPTLIMPAHDEAATIAATLAALAPVGCDPAAMPLIVVCNGCTDATATIAAAAAPHARVISTPERGKAGAINHALAEAAPGPVIVIDADVRPDPGCLEAIAAALDEPGVMAASAAARFELDHAPWPVRAYYRAFASHPYLRGGVGGSGIYGLSAAGRAAIAPLPAVVGDDQYVRVFFPEAAQRRITRCRSGQAVATSVHPPHSVHAMIATERRSRRGDQEVHALLPGARASTSLRATLGWLLRTALARPIDCAVLVAIKLWARATWGRHRSDAGWDTLRRA